MPKLSEVVKMLQEDLQKNGDTNNFGVGVILNGSLRYAIHAFTNFEVTRDLNYIDGLTVLVGEQEVKTYSPTVPVPENSSAHYADGWTYADRFVSSGGDPDSGSPDGWHHEKYEGWWDRLKLARL
ncbi:hypothetical protein [Flavobacterium sp.]|uniref:hypothetical protein n=1 Tax=Flavobacterium sp. TaxID=239 RepID=UPI002629FD2A|nr:hypothetical protein [Flavobacterium sp.]